VANAVAEHGRLDILINNAGVMLLGPIEDAPTEEWRRMVNVNVLGLLYCTTRRCPICLARPPTAGGAWRRGDVSSVAGRVARRDSGVYNATNGGCRLHRVVSSGVYDPPCPSGGGRAWGNSHRAGLSQPQGGTRADGQELRGIEMMQSEDIATPSLTRSPNAPCVGQRNPGAADEQER